MHDYDVVVVGAGNGGLTAAATLARNGLATLLLEKHNIPGGCATTFVRGRFEFEVALHQLSGMGTPEFPGPLRPLLTDLGVLDDLSLVQMENLYRVVVPDRLDITLPANKAGIVDALSTRFPKEADGIGRFFDLAWAYAEELVSIFMFHDPESSPEKYPLFFQHALKPAQDVLDAHFSDPLLQAAVSPYWSYMGAPLKFMPFGNLAMLLWVYTEFKPFHMKGGSQAMSSALLHRFTEAGGTARFSCGVSRILVENGRAVGVVTSGGETIRSRFVVSNVGPISTYVDLLEPGQTPPEALSELGDKDVGVSAFTVYAGLDADPADVGIHQTTNFILADLDTQRVCARGHTLEFPEVMLLTCYDVEDPDFSPAGACQAALVTLGFADPWLAVPPAEYHAAKCRFARPMLDLAERVAPGFNNAIEEIETASPLTHMRYLGHPGGAIYGFTQLAKDSEFLPRPGPALDNLFFAGAWTAGGGFQPTLESGVAAARAVLKHMG